MMIYRMHLREIFEDDLTIELLGIKEKKYFYSNKKEQCLPYLMIQPMACNSFLNNNDSEHFKEM